MSRKRSNATEPMRKCVGCGESKPKRELVRIAFYEGTLTLDTTGRAPGRGVYLCKNPQCVEQAQKKNGFSRSFRTKISAEMTEPIFEELLHAE